MCYNCIIKCNHFKPLWSCSYKLQISGTLFSYRIAWLIKANL